jgi:hypothetical protein
MYVTNSGESVRIDSFALGLWYGDVLQAQVGPRFVRRVPNAWLPDGTDFEGYGSWNLAEGETGNTTYAALHWNGGTCTLYVLRPEQSAPEVHSFTDAGFVEGGAGQYLKQHVPEAKTIPYESLAGLIRYRSDDENITDNT